MISQRITSGLLMAILAVAALLWVYGRYQQKPVPVADRAPAELPGVRPRAPGNYIKVLSIDGDGVRLLPVLHCLAYLEKRSGRPVWQLFDVMVGTSGGGLIVAALAAPASSEKARFTAAELLEEYPAIWKKICRTSAAHPVLSLNGRTAPRYLTRERHAVLDQLFGKTQLGEALTTIVLPAFSVAEREPFYFASDMGKSTSPSGAPGRSVTEAGDYFLADAVIAATADPAVFAPSQIRTIDREEMKTVTGAQAYASSPALIAVSEALLRYPGKPCVVISFGEGRIEKEPPSTTRELGWDTTASPGELLRMAADGSAASVNQIATVLHRFGSGPLAGYVRIEPALGSQHANAYDTSTGNIEALEAASRAFILDKYTTLDRTADFLAQP